MSDSKTTFDLQDPKLYLNRELGLLEFQRRVLAEAADERWPLLERVKFLSIFGSNMDEFFMVRVGGLKMQIAEGVFDASPDGLTPAEQVAAIRKIAVGLLQEAHLRWADDLLKNLDKAGIHVLDYGQLDEKQREASQEYFDEVVFPVLTPLAFDPGHPFPHISNLSLNLAILIRDHRGNERFARLKIPASLPRLIPLKRSSGGTRKDGTSPYHHYFVWMEQVVLAHLASLFPGMKIVEAHLFRVIRNADLVVQELEGDDLLETMQESVRERRFGSVVCVEINRQMPPRIREVLISQLEVDSRDVFAFDGPLGLQDFRSLLALDRPDLKDPLFQPRIPKILKKNNGDDANLADSIRAGDILLHHPYDSFVPVVNFLRQAAYDRDVLAIKQTLYRVGTNAPVVRALLEARRDYGKQVSTLVELKARFDEESNISWARMLEQEGVHVVYGLLGLKTHAKMALVVRREGEHIRRYIHLGTGNYNAATAQLYEDIGLFTSDPQICADATDLFNYLTGYSAKTEYRKLLVAPVNLRQKFEALIDREIEHHKAGRPAHLVFKFNALVDKAIIQKLYTASQAGLKVDLVVRSICCLRPGIKGLSENIRVVSILGRFLEHSRIYYFENAGDPQVYLGSADLMPRNLDRRVEVLFPIEDPQNIRYIRQHVLDTYLHDNFAAHLMQPDGSYKRLSPPKDAAEINAQKVFLSHGRS
ncbi:MAG: polyphosphate kinase 1 [Anaerolineales bacterium]|jgi:polyphosphate kinase|nr:polyphosphate kinase 1 [Anaerolineales bacterium]